MKFARINWMVCAFLVIGCGGGGSDDPEPRPEPDPPAAAALVFPANNSECNEGTVVSATLSEVTFRWNLAQNADRYELEVRNLNTNAVLNANSTTDEATLALLRGAPYEWQVVSRANGVSETASSPTWRFYNEGPGIENYAPFPAVAISPQRGAHIPAATTVALEWEASDIDGDITGYEVYFGTSDNPDQLAGSTPENQLEVSVTSGNTYFWKVRTIDVQGNSSESEVFSFLVQ